MDRVKEEVISNIRACLISFKGRVSIRQLENDYRTLLGERIPYSKLGYKSTEDFISKIPSLSVSKNASGEWYVDAKASEKSNHITDMVNKQKPGKRRNPRRAVQFDYYSAPQTRKWSPANIHYKPKKFKPPQRTSAVSHNQLVERSPQHFSVKSRLYIPEYSTFRRADSAPAGNLVPADRSVEELSAHGNASSLHTPVRSNYNKNDALDSPHVTSNGTRLRSSNFSENPDEPVDSQALTDSLLKTSRKRIIRMMSEVSLDRDSGNSSPTSDAKCATPDDIVLTDDPVTDLRNIAEKYKLGLVGIATVPMKPKKRGRTIHNCTITVDGQSYLSYPLEFYNKESAQEYTAKLALDELIPKCARKKSLLISISKDIKDRIPPMLKTHHQGIWSRQIEADYVERYKEQLPVNWLEILDSCDCVAVEKIQERYVLRYCLPGTVFDPLYPAFMEQEDNISSYLGCQNQKKNKNMERLMPLDISIPTNTVQFGEGNRLFAQITCIMSLNEVWCRQWDTPEFAAYNEMNLLMEPFYIKEGQKYKADSIQIGHYYVAHYDCNWYRVRALEIDEKAVNCFLIDFGDEYLIDKDDLYIIPREFATCQAQAFVCRLAGLEDLYEENISLDKLSSYVCKEVVLEEALNDVEDIHRDQNIAVVMYDFANGNSLNEEILQCLIRGMPAINPSRIDEVFVSHVATNGDVYIQVHSKGFASLQSLLQNLEADLERNPPTHCAEKINKTIWTANKDRLYLRKDVKDGHWYRIKILDMSPSGDHAQIQFVDRGNDEVVKIADEVSYPLDKISDVLHQFPAQSVRIKMALETVPSNFLELASKSMKINSPVLLKIIGNYENNEENTPIGEFYKSSDEGLICINKAIILEYEINSTKSHEDNLLKGTKIKLAKLTQLTDEALQKNNVPSGGSLLRPNIPVKGDYFEVIIPFAVNPWDFFVSEVQPYASKDELKNMMDALQNRYKNATFSPLQIKMILPGQIYATKHTDGIWYRTSVLKVIHAGSISVFYCDFGYYSSLCLNQLIPLDQEFTKLPYQALKAKLSDIKPKKNKWSMEDCEYFTELVRGKSFVSVLTDMEKDELYESDTVLKLKLIDTSTDDDVYIDQELIKKNIAIKAD